MQQLVFIFGMTIAIISFFVLIFIASGIKVLKEWDRAVVLRLGKFYGIRGPGIIWITPIIDKVVNTISLRLQKYELIDTIFYTQESMEVRISGTVFYRVVDTVKAATSVEDEKEAAIAVVDGVIIDTIRASTYDDLLMDRSAFCETVKDTANQAVEGFGLMVTEVDLRVER